MNALTQGFDVEEVSDESNALGASDADERASWLDKYSIVAKIRAAVLGNTIVLSLLAIGIVGTTAYTAKDAETLSQLAEAEIRFGHIAMQLGESRDGLRDIADRGDTGSVGKVSESLERASALIEKTLADNKLLPVETVSKFQEINQRIEDAQAEIAAAQDTGKLAETANETLQSVATTYADLSQYALSFHEFGDSWTASILAQAKLYIGIFLLLIIIGPFLSFMVARRIVNNVAGTIIAVARSAESLAAGNTSETIPGRQRQDEIGALARSLIVFRDTSKREIAVQREMAENQAQLNQAQAEAQQEKAQALQNVAREFQASIGQAVETIVAAAEELVQNANTLSKASDRAQSDLSGSVETLEETTSGVMAAAAASDEFALSISEISSQATQSATIAREAGEVAGSANDKIEELSRDTAEIGEIVELIQSIATRTNLLALNASIEAARGSEAGRGFAVVASEVKELASRTAAATDNIAQKISAIQNSTGASVDALKSVVEEISRLEASSVSIASAVDQQSVTGRELAKNIDIAARNTDRISSTMAGVEATASRAGAATKNMQSAAHELQAQAQILKESAASFLATIDQPTQSTSERAA